MVKKNLITLPQAKRLLLAALAEESLTPEEAIELVRYHVRRNEIARLTHRKRKLAMLQNRRMPKGGTATLKSRQFRFLPRA
ncbi:MAG: hypothetical protein ACYDDN_04450 [Candidatus Desulforudaceae bacterium]